MATRNQRKAKAKARLNAMLDVIAATKASTDAKASIIAAREARLAAYPTTSGSRPGDHKQARVKLSAPKPTPYGDAKYLPPLWNARNA